MSSVLLLTFISTNTYADCYQAFNRFRVRQAVTNKVLSENEDAFMRRLNNIERVGTWLRKLRKNKSPAIHAKMSKRLTKLDAYLFVGDYATAHRELRTLFREVEFSSLAVRALDEQLESVRALSVRNIDQAKQLLGQEDIPARHWLDQALAKSTTLDGVVDELVYIRSTHETKLGSRFQEYLLAKEHLEALTVPGACSPECSLNTQKLLDSLGVKYQSDRTRFSSFLEVGDDINSNAIRDLIDTHRVAVISRLKRERNSELMAVLSEFATQPAIIQKILFGLTGIPGMHKLKIVRLLKVFLDAVAQTKHVPLINQIVRSQDGAAKKLDQVLQQNGIFGGNEFLINFSRRNDLETKRVWSQIVAEASTQNSDLASQLLKADQMARSRGPLDLLQSSSVLPRWLMMAVSTGGIGYFWFSKGEIQSVEVEPSVSEIPLEGEEDSILDEASEELSDAEVQEVILDSIGREPNSVAAQGQLSQFYQWLISFF